MAIETRITNDPVRLVIRAQQFRAEIAFGKTNEILGDAGIVPILLKGPHLGNTIYESPIQRTYCDLDLLVKPEDFSKAATVLAENGFQPLEFATFSPKVQDDFKHWEYRSPQGVTIELHRWLSGHDRFPIDWKGLFARAESFVFGETNALGLGTEDLLLQLCLHMGTSYFKVIEKKHILDIALLVKRRSVDWPSFLQRTDRAGARAIAFYCLKAAQLQHGASIPAGVLSRLRPGKVRRLYLEKHIDPGRYPIYRMDGDSIAKVKKRLLLPLMDKPSQWLRFLARIAWGKMRAGKQMISTETASREGKQGEERSGCKG